MTLDEYREKEKQDSNLFWRLSSGEHLNLLEEAINRIGELEAVKEVYKKHVRMGDYDNPFIQFFCDNQRHLVCKPYSIENLHKTAEELNIKSSWFHKDHYDIPKHRVEEIIAKCTVVHPKRIVNIINGVDDEHCPKCGGKLKTGKALKNRMGGIPDFIGSDEIITVSPTGDTDLIDVRKCVECGFSFL